MSTKSGRRSSIRELKPAASKKRSRRIETKTVAEAAIATEALEVEASEEALPEPSESPSSEGADSTPPEAVALDDASAPADAPEAVVPDDEDPQSAEAVASDEAAAERAAEDEDIEQTTIEAAMLAELSEGVSDNTEAFLEGLIEALLFSSDRPMPAKELARAAGVDRRRAEELVAALKRRYETGGLTIEEVAGGYVMRSSPRYASYIQKLLALRPVRLSRAQLETLAIVAYRQPVTKPEVDDIRGVDSGQVLKGLLERELLKIVGKKDEPGRPMLYGTTTAFLELLNLQSLKDLPTLREYTELSEESRRKFAEETGESPEGALDGAAAQGDTTPEGADAPAAATDENAAPQDGDDGTGATPAEALDAEPSAGASDGDDVEPEGDSADEATRDVSEPPSSAEDSDESDARAAEPPAARASDDDGDEGIDLDLLADASEIDHSELESEGAPTSRRG
jgi:segregation and condensation protein B